MATLPVSVLAENRNIHHSRAVLIQRAKNAEQCECLAAWIDDEECICGQPAVEIPLSVDKLKAANRLIGEIERLEHTCSVLQKMDDDTIHCRGETENARYHNRYDDDGDTIFFSLPRKVVLAALDKKRVSLLLKLQETGIVSIDQVQNVRSVPG